MWSASFLLLLSLTTSNAFRSVCYYTNWSQYRSSLGQFYPEDVDATLCTHLVYSFANIVGTDIKPFEWNDDSTPWSKGMYERTMALKTQNPALKIILAVGGYNMASTPFINIVRSSISRSSFAQSAISFLRQRNFDGLDVDWEYPGQRGSTAADKINFVLLMQELKNAFENEARISGSSRLLLTAAVPAGKNTIDVGYDVSALSNICDFISLMTYDLHGSWDSTTGINSPLYAHPSEQGDDTFLNLDWVARYYISLGAPRDKINIGMATYGRSFTLANPNKNKGVGAPASRAGQAGRYTMENGFISYYEICQLIQSGAQVFNEPSQRASYLVHRDLWVGYDDISSIQEKACYARQNGYGGIMFWALDLDDFSGRSCGQGPFPLITAAVQEMAKPASTTCFRQTVSNPNPSQSSQGPQLYQPLTVPQTNNKPPTTPSSGQAANPLIRTLPTYGLSPLPPKATLIPNTSTPFQPVTQPSQTPKLLQPLTQPNQPTQTVQPVTIATLPPVTIATVPPRTVTTTGGRGQQGITTPAFTQTSGFDCTRKINDFYADPLSCDYFYICANNVTYRVRCALGLKFNTQLKHCDFAYNVKCTAPSFTAQPSLLPTQSVTSPTVLAAASTKLYQPITYPPVTQRPSLPLTNQRTTPKVYQPVTLTPYQPMTNSQVSQKPYQPGTYLTAGSTQKTLYPVTNPTAVSTQKPYQPVTNLPKGSAQIYQPNLPVRSTQKTYQPITNIAAYVSRKTNKPVGATNPTIRSPFQPKPNPPSVAATTPKLYQPLTNSPGGATQNLIQPIKQLPSSQKPYQPLTYPSFTQRPLQLRPGSGSNGNLLQPASQTGRR